MQCKEGARLHGADLILRPHISDHYSDIDPSSGWSALGAAPPPPPSPPAQPRPGPPRSWCVRNWCQYFNLVALQCKENTLRSIVGDMLR